MRKIYVLLVNFVIAVHTFGQPMARLDSIFKSNGLEEIAVKIEDNGWVTFDKMKKIDPTTIFEKYGFLFGLADGNRMILSDTIQDNNGMTHYVFRQFCQEYELEGISYIIHSKDGITLSGNGKMVPLLKQRRFEKDASIQDIYLDVLKQYNPQVSLSVYDKKELKYDIIFVPIPNTEPTDERNYKLACKFDVPTCNIDSIKTVYVDTDKKIPFKDISPIRKAYSYHRESMDITTLYNGLQSLEYISYIVLWPWLRHYQLAFNNDLNGKFKLVGCEKMPSGNWGVVEETDCKSCLVNTDSRRVVASGLWAAEQAYKFFKGKGLNGSDGQG
jgi:hypothetical protein